MKLLAKTSLYYLLCIIPVLVVAAVVNYFALASIVKESNQDYFKKRKAMVANFLEKQDTIGLQFFLQNGEASLVAIPKNYKIKDTYCDTVLFDNYENDMADVQLLTTEIKTKNGSYRLQLWRSTLDDDELVESVINSQIGIFIFLLFVLIGINWLLALTLWKPFYSTIKTLHSFRASDKEKPILKDSSIKEFKELNFSVDSMIDKMMTDFRSQKQFTENASHEIQTPIAIIKAKIELLIQSDKLGKSEADLISKIDEAATKLSRLNKSLLLLTKIENQQFTTKENVSINAIIIDSLEFFKEYIEEKEIKVERIISTEKIIFINPDLCSVLVNNILQNAIRHNIQKGEISIELNANQLIISNTGQTQFLDETKIFERFQKSSSSIDSIGLGLAIAKEIADVNGFTLYYKFRFNKHCFGVKF